MPIVIHRPHSRPHDEARALAEKVALHMASEFGMKWHWDDDVLHFERGGVNGSLTVKPTEIQVHVKLGFLLSALQPKIEQEIHKFLDEEFGQR